jgi:methyl-accepting chemotaxis protein
MFEPKSIRTKLLGLLALVNAVIALVGWLGYRATSDANENVASLTDSIVPAVDHLGYMDEAVTDVLLQTRRGLYGVQARDDAMIRRAEQGYREAARRLDEARGRFEASLRTEEAKRVHEKFREAHARWVPELEGVWDRIRRGDLEAADRHTREKLDPRTLDTRARMNELKATLTELGSKIGATSRSAGERSVRVMLFVCLFAFVGSAVTGLLMVNAITRPLAKITAAARAIARGDVHQEIDHHSADEVGQLADSFRETVDYIRGVAAAADAAARGDLDHRIVPRSDRDVLSHSFRKVTATLRDLIAEGQTLTAAFEDGRTGARADASRFQGGYAELLRGTNAILDSIGKVLGESMDVMARLAARDLTARFRLEVKNDWVHLKDSLNTAAQNLHDSMAQVAVAAEQVSAAAEQIASGSQSVARGAAEQASALEETSSSLEEMASMTRQNAASAGEANALAGTARGASESGVTAMGQMSRSMTQIRSSAEGTAAIIRDINDIAFQTNLLALNAAVEAARAGDAGRGFAVVAEEVRTLAIRSKEAAKKTEALIQESVALARDGEGVSRQVGEHFDQIVDTVRKVTDLIAEIAQASAEQSRGIDQVSKAVVRMEQVTQENSANSEESASAAQQLSGQAQELATLVARFRLADTAAVRAPNVRAAAAPAPAPAAPGRRAPSPVPKGAVPPAAHGKANGHAGNGHGPIDPETVIPLDDDPAFADF